jgi:hypothetical protein
LRGRNADLIEIAGKRASLGDLTRRLLACRVYAMAPCSSSIRVRAPGVARLAALAVAPELDEAAVLAALRAHVDRGVPAAPVASGVQPASQRDRKSAARGSSRRWCSRRSERAIPAIHGIFIASPCAFAQTSPSRLRAHTATARRSRDSASTITFYGWRE